MIYNIYPEKTMIQIDTCTPVLTTALSTIFKTWKQPKCPSTEKWIRKVWYRYIAGILLSHKKEQTLHFIICAFYILVKKFPHSQSYKYILLFHHLIGLIHQINFLIDSNSLLKFFIFSSIMYIFPSTFFKILIIVIFKSLTYICRSVSNVYFLTLISIIALPA